MTLFEDRDPFLEADAIAREAFARVVMARLQECSDDGTVSCSGMAGRYWCKSSPADDATQCDVLVTADLSIVICLTRNGSDGASIRIDPVKLEMLSENEVCETVRKWLEARRRDQERN
jgi:hypothetical protein